MEEAQVLFELELADNADREAVEELIRTRLHRLAVQDLAITSGTSRVTGAEIVAIIVVGVTVVKAGRELTEELRKLITEVTELVKDGKGLMRALVSVGEDMVPTENVAPKQLKQIAAGE
jgi:hypothetical protein